MLGLRGYFAVAGAIALLGAGAYVWTLRASNAVLTAENASLTRSVASLTMQKEQSALAREVEAARADRMEAETKRLDAKIETIFRGIPDALLDPALAAIINGLRETN